jgi:hypothetical protein
MRASRVEVLLVADLFGGPAVRRTPRHSLHKTADLSYMRLYGACSLELDHGPACQPTAEAHPWELCGCCSDVTLRSGLVGGSLRQQQIWFDGLQG